jgi:hypothetical protein
MALDEEKLALIEQIQEAELSRRDGILRTFIPENPAAIPFAAQIAFFRDSSRLRCMRCGNRAAKTFTEMRDLAWKITRNHWYIQKWNLCNLSKKDWKDRIGTEAWEVQYLKSAPKVFWLIGNDYTFVNDVMFGQYLEKMIPPWFINKIHRTNQGNIDFITFKNGDTLRCKTYMQQDASKMGYSIDDAYMDEMPPDVSLISEISVRTFDRDGGLTLAFTPLVQNEGVRIYVDSSCESGAMSLHCWSVADNPLYRDNPERMSRVLAEYAHLPENLRNSRLRGDWYYETPQKSVFEGVDLVEVDDFEVPSDWRHVRFTDPASHVTGHAIFAEDPKTSEWYCIHGAEISFGDIATAEQILERIEHLKPFESFKYYASVYDNAEAWFGAYGRKYGYRPCILKNREEAVMTTRSMLDSGRIKFFRKGAKVALDQIRNYRFNKDGDKIVRKHDHVVDCVMYFCREIPSPIKEPATAEDEKKVMLEAHMKKQFAPKKPQMLRRLVVMPSVYQTVNRRGAR